MKLVPGVLASGFWLLALGPGWTPLTSGVNVTFRGVSAVSDQIAWASGSGSTVLRTEDGGATWRPITVTADRVDFRDVDAIDDNMAYALSIGNGPASRIYKTTDAGATWMPLFLNNDPEVFLDAMTFVDANRGIVIGDSIKGESWQFFIMSTVDGHTWNRIAPASLPAALPNEGAFAASGTNVAMLGDDIWIGTGAAAQARVLHSADLGRTWSVAATPLVAGASAGIFSIAFRDAQHGVIVGGDHRKEAEAIDNLAWTDDGGKTWTLVKEHGLSGFRSVVAYVPGMPQSLVAVGPQGADVSTDDGRTWTPIAGTGFHTFSFSPSGRIGFAAGGRGTLGKLTMR